MLYKALSICIFRVEKSAAVMVQGFMTKNCKYVLLVIYLYVIFLLRILYTNTIVVIRRTRGGYPEDDLNRREKVA